MQSKSPAVVMAAVAFAVSGCSLGSGEEPSPSPSAEQVRTVQVPVSKIDIARVMSGSVSAERKRAYNRLFREWVAAAQAGDCGRAWAMIPRREMRLAIATSRDNFCANSMVTLARLDYARVTAEVEDGQVRVGFTGCDSPNYLFMHWRKGRPEFRSAGLMFPSHLSVDPKVCPKYYE